MLANFSLFCLNKHQYYPYFGALFTFLKLTLLTSYVKCLYIAVHNYVVRFLPKLGREFAHGLFFAEFPSKIPQ
jgi:hypothetical protein